MKTFLTIIAYLGFFSTVCGQSMSLTAKLVNADSVYLISHKSIPQSSVKVIDSSGMEVSFPLLIDGKLNESSVKEKVIIKADDIDGLAKMLNYRKDNVIEHGNCFDPHHAIIIIKSGRTSYIDLCFACMHFSTSEDISLCDIEEKTWKGLYSLYRAKGIRYEMNGK